MFWQRSNHIDTAIKNKVLERSGGYCECRLSEHNHENSRCGNRLGFQHYFFSISSDSIQSITDVIVLCPMCYRAILSRQRKKF